MSLPPVHLEPRRNDLVVHVPRFQLREILIRMDQLLERAAFVRMRGLELFIDGREPAGGSWRRSGASDGRIEKGDRQDDEGLLHSMFLLSENFFDCQGRKSGDLDQVLCRT